MTHEVYVEQNGIRVCRSCGRPRAEAHHTGCPHRGELSAAVRQPDPEPIPPIGLTAETLSAADVD